MATAGPGLQAFNPLLRAESPVQLRLGELERFSRRPAGRRWNGRRPRQARSGATGRLVGTVPTWRSSFWGRWSFEKLVDLLKQGVGCRFDRGVAGNSELVRQLLIGLRHDWCGPVRTVQILD